MEENRENREEELAVLVGLSSHALEEDENSDEKTMDELEELLKTAGGVSIARIIQNRQSPDPKTFIGEGKALEIKEYATQNSATLIIFDNEISPSQTRALEDLIGIRVIDRSTLILDIFASRARTKEGKLQVEYAQYKYLLPRLTGMWQHLVRQTSSGGKSPIGTRGPGETQLETDRRHMRERLKKVGEELEKVKTVRANQRRKREKTGLPLVAIVGYTNAGKSTLLNTLTGSSIEANDRLFDTLDPTTRLLRLSDSQEIAISDTVGFIKKLPHHLIEAFKATLEELSYADLLLHVIDLSNQEHRAQEQVVEKLIAELNNEKKPVIKVYNKCDRVSLDIYPKGENTVLISAMTGEGLDLLKEKIISVLAEKMHSVSFTLPYGASKILDMLYKSAEVKKAEYKEEGIFIEALCDGRVYEMISDWVK
ncbi:MAG: GTPase HflX [Bacillota bacterium]|nr:GTPase HflX [Bacillota bacterium]